MLVFLNLFFFAFHTAFTIFNVTGWAFQKTRKVHLLTMIATAFSWFILGIWYGFGYCFCTDWHWQVRDQLGYKDSSDSYIHFLVLKITGVDFDEQFVETTTLIVFIVSFVLTIWLNIRDWKRKNA